MAARTLTTDDLRWLVCPVCHKSLRLLADNVQCLGCGRRYPVLDGIPILLRDRAL
jgi:uncharacterized protein YbaR (Trm112 family)